MTEKKAKMQLKSGSQAEGRQKRGKSSFRGSGPHSDDRDGNDRSEGKHTRRKKFEKKERGKPFKKRVPTGDAQRKEISELKQLYETFDFENLQNFKEAPLSVRTKAGLDRCGYTKPTRIQKETLALALNGRDVLGAAKTGSGKTLAFLIPVLELLFRELWTRMDGLGALIITPTRELAYQIFEVLKKVGSRHDFSAGLIIGGTEVGFERNRIHGTNIIICTPGRLLQHMDQNPLLDPTNLKILVLDEADRILDMGFERDMNAILENLPPHRQTLLFSATQTKSVKDLARLSLNNPCYVSVHEQAAQATPDQLHQDYLVCELQDKLSLLWSFLKNHKSKKIIVFMSCCKQVQFVNTIIRRLRPGTTVLHLHGNMSQPRRLAIYDEFCSKQSAILLATDLAARGLDFPKVNWVLQLDCPEDTETYIHRVGRTARFENAGKALLVLLPSEESGMVKRLEERKIPVNKIAVNPRRFYDIQRKVEAMCARDAELKASAQRCFVGYLKYVFMQKDKQTFQVEKLDLDLYARSLGLIITPRARFLQKYLASKGIKLPKQPGPEITPQKSQESDEDNEPIVGEGQEKPKKMQLSKKIEKFSFDMGIDSDEEIFTKKGKPLLENDDIQKGSDDEEEQPEGNLGTIEDEIRAAKANKIITKVQAAKKVLKKKNIVPNKKVVFDEEGKAVSEEGDVILGKPLAGVEEKGGIDIELSKQLMQEQDRIDKQTYREKIRTKHREERLKAKAERRAAAAGGEVVLDIGHGEGGDEDLSGEEHSRSDVEDSAGEDRQSGGDEEDSEVESFEPDSAGDSMGEDDEVESEDAPEIGSRKRPVQREEVDSEGSDGGEGDDEMVHAPKKPMKTKGKFGLKRRRVEGWGEELDTGLDLKGDEELALRLLQG